MKMIHLVDMRIRLLKVSVLITLQNPASLYYQRSKTAALKNLQQKLVITNNDMADFNISFT